MGTHTHTHTHTHNHAHTHTRTRTHASARAPSAGSMRRLIIGVERHLITHLDATLLFSRPRCPDTVTDRGFPQASRPSGLRSGGEYISLEANCYYLLCFYSLDSTTGSCLKLPIALIAMSRFDCPVAETALLFPSSVVARSTRNLSLLLLPLPS